MSKKRRIEITVETDREWLIRRRSGSRPVWCAECSQESEMVSAIEAAWLAGVDSNTIYKWAGAGSVHFTETSERLLLICLNSLPKHKE